jgi:hypothetical protein
MTRVALDCCSVVVFGLSVASGHFLAGSAQPPTPRVLLVLVPMGANRGSGMLNTLRHKVSDIPILWAVGSGGPEVDWPGTQPQFFRKHFTGNAMAGAVYRSLCQGV